MAAATCWGQICSPVRSLCAHCFAQACLCTRLFHCMALAPSFPASWCSYDADGSGHKHLNAEFVDSGLKALGEGPSSRGSYCNVGMSGQDVFKFAVRAVPNVSWAGPQP
jgi:hypothetical protein